MNKTIWSVVFAFAASCLALPCMAADVVARMDLSVSSEKPILLVPCRESPVACTTFARNIGFDRLDVMLDGRSELSFTVDATGGDVAWHSPIDLSKFAGKKLELVLHGADQFGDEPFAGFRMGSEADLPRDVYCESYRPQFHFTPKYGWSNDPNGLSYYNGQWHVFYQSVACSTIWRPSNAWRHAVSDDLVHWKELKPAIEADDCAAAWSGSAVVCGDRHVLVYTRRGWAGFMEQAVAESTNGVDYSKCGTVLPQRTSGNRDPFVFYHKPTEAWVMALFIETNEVQTLEILSSKDLRNWRHESYLEGDRYDAPGNPPRRFLHECPILVEVPVEGTGERRWLVSGGSMVYRIGQFDGHVFTPETEVVTPFPQGIGPMRRNAYYKPYYAGQVFNDAPGGRVVYMPWYKLETPKGARFSQGLGLPLEFTLARTPEGLRLRFLPVKELESLREREAVPLEKFDGELAEVEYSATVGNDARIVFDLRGVRLVYDAAKGTLSSGGEVSVPWKVENGKFAIRAYVDRIGLEVFSQDGFQVLPDPTARPDVKRRDLSVATSGAVLQDACRVWKLKGIWGSKNETRAERHYDFRAKLCQVHERGVRDASIHPEAGDFVFADGVTIAVPGDADEVLNVAAHDFEDYLWTSMGVAAVVAKGAGGGVSVALDSSLADRQYKVSISPGGVRIRAKDSRAAAQALYHLEDLMNLRRAPYLAAAEEDRTMLFSPRMTHSGFACDDFPDPYLARIAHAGMDAILVFVKDVDKTKGRPDYQDINDTIRRAKRFGIDTYLYSYLHAFAHPDQGPAPFDASYGRVSAAYPEARGIILVGESCEFPSKDPRVIPIAARDRGNKHKGDSRQMSGYFPCSDYPQWVKAVAGAVRRHNPNCDIVFWTYNWGGEKDEYRRPLLQNLQKDVSLMATWEMFDKCVLPNGYSCKCADYTQTFVGPGHYFKTEAQWAKEFGLRLYSQSCTGGVTWDFGSVPYLPVPQHWKLRWDGIVAAHGEWGLSGLMEGHHQGWYPNFVSELAKEAFTRGGIPFEKHIRMIAARDFGDENAEAVVAAWQKWSDASAYIAPTHANQYGMFRIGPSYPFNALGPRIQIGIGGDGSEDYPRNKHASNGLGICRMNYADDQLRQWIEGLDYFPRLDIPADELRLELDGLRMAYGLFIEGAAALRHAAEGLSGERRGKALKVAGLGEYMGRTCRTAVNVKAATAEEDVVLSKTATEPEKSAARSRIMALARDEYENAKAALPLVDADSRLGWEPTMEYCGGREQIEWKLRRMERLYGIEIIGEGE